MRITGNLLVTLLLLGAFLHSCAKQEMSVMESGTSWSLLEDHEVNRILSPEELMEIGAKVRRKGNSFYYNIVKRSTPEELELYRPQWISTGEKELLNLINSYAEVGFATPQEDESAKKFIAFWESIVSARPISARRFHYLADDFLLNESITLESSPSTYYAVHILKGIYAPTDNEDGASTKTEDDMYCVVTGFGPQCGGATVTQQIIAATAGAAATYFIPQIIENDSPAATAGAALVGSLIALAINNISSCSVTCDNCAAALGIADVNPTDCDVTALEAIGAFEFSEQFEWFIDANRDGVYFPGGITSDNRFPQSSFPSQTVPFDIYVDVTCDGETLQPWPSGEPGITVDPILGVTSYLYGNISGPPLSNGFFYPPNTNLCFTLTVFNIAEYSFTGWETTSGGNPSSGPPTNYFCTTFTNPQPITGSVNAVFEENCTGDIMRIPFSFLICGTC
jgi:hypothetical protein